VECGGCNYKDTKTYKNQGQGFIPGEQLRNVWYDSCLKAWKWKRDMAEKREAVDIKYSQCRRKNIVEGIPEKDRKKILCPEYGTGRKQLWWDWRIVAYPENGEAQQSSVQKEIPEGTTKGENTQRDIRRTLKMLREVWLDIGVEKVDIYEGIIVKALLDSGMTGMFIDKRMVVKHRFKLQRLERPVVVRNVDGTNNSGGAIIHQVKVNVYYKNHIERMRMDVCDLGKIDKILGILWLQAHNPEINWKTEEVKMTRCLPLCRRDTKLNKRQKAKKGKRVAILKEEKIVRWVIDNKEDWGSEEEVEADYKKIEEMVPKRFLRWRKVFGKVESKRMPIRKIWDHTIDLKETFKPQKRRIYPLSKNKREEAQNFVNNQLKKRYIRPSKFPQISPVFFVGKKNGSKRMIMDYCNLNNQIVKNNYPLLLITDLIDNMGSKQVFMKMDLW